jgi:hypothetical protein
MITFMLYSMLLPNFSSTARDAIPSNINHAHQQQKQIPYHHHSSSASRPDAAHFPNYVQGTAFRSLNRPRSFSTSDLFSRSIDDMHISFLNVGPADDSQDVHPSPTKMRKLQHIHSAHQYDEEDIHDFDGIQSPPPTMPDSNIATPDSSSAAASPSTSNYLINGKRRASHQSFGSGETSFSPLNSLRLRHSLIQNLKQRELGDKQSSFGSEDWNNSKNSDYTSYDELEVVRNSIIDMLRNQTNGEPKNLLHPQQHHQHPHHSPQHHHPSSSSSHHPLQSSSSSSMEFDAIHWEDAPVQKSRRPSMSPSHQGSLPPSQNMEVGRHPHSRRNSQQQNQNHPSTFHMMQDPKLNPFIMEEGDQTPSFEEVPETQPQRSMPKNGYLDTEPGETLTWNGTQPTSPGLRMDLQSPNPESPVEPALNQDVTASSQKKKEEEEEYMADGGYWRYFKSELMSTDFDEGHDVKKERVQNFLRVPSELEKVNLHCLQPPS